MKKRGKKSGKQQQQPAAAAVNGHALSFKLGKLLDPDSSWDKDKLLDALHWIRQGLGLAFGLLWGAIPLVSGIWILPFLLLSTGIIYGYYTRVLKIDEDDYGGHGTLLQEGLVTSFALFLLAWILIYSLAHF